MKKELKNQQTSEELHSKVITPLKSIKKMLLVMCTSNGNLDYLTNPESPAVFIKHSPGKEAEIVSCELENVLYQYVKFRQACVDAIDRIDKILYPNIK